MRGISGGKGGIALKGESQLFVADSAFASLNFLEAVWRHASNGRAFLGRFGARPILNED